MDFQPSDYLADLNLVFDGPEVSPTLDEARNQADLELFSQAEFFDLDVFSNGAYKAHKLDAKPTHYVKQEDAETVSVAATPELAAHENVSDVNEMKRRRNTAASARFRIKKKLKEKQMEQQAKDLQDRLNALEGKYKTLEMENKCLKQLILEKNEKKNCALLESIKKRSLGDSAAASGSSSFTFTT